MYRPTQASLNNLWFKEEDKWIWKLPVVEDKVDWNTYIMYFEDVWFTIEMYYWVWTSIYPKSYLDLIQFINIFEL